LNQQLAAHGQPPPSFQAESLWQLVGKWENLAHFSGFCLVSLPFSRKDVITLGSGITFLEEVEYKKIRDTARDRSFKMSNAEEVVELWMEGVTYEKLINGSTEETLDRDRPFIRETFLADDPDANRDEVTAPARLLHLETGQWLSMYVGPENVTESNETARFGVTHLATIPHGNALVESGSFASVDCSSSSEPCMDAEYVQLARQYSADPVNLDCQPDVLTSYYKEVKAKYGQKFGRSPVAFLANATVGLKVRSFLKWEASSLHENDRDGLSNMPFLERQIHPSAANTTMYLLTVEADDGSTYQLIQYILGVFFELGYTCGGVQAKFPHINLNTLKRMT
jgi:hypothetical protein